MKTKVSCAVLLALILSLTVSSEAANGDRTGNWIRLKKVWEYDVQLVAKFAVSEHNKQTGQNLEYIRIYRGYIDGLYWRLYVQATDHVEPRRYETLVKDTPWNNGRELIYFRSSS